MSSLASTALVPGATGAYVRRPVSPSEISEATLVGEKRAAPSAPNLNFTVSRLEIIRRHFQREGFSEPLVNLLLAGNRTTTLSTYESAWRNWADWCFRRGENPLSISLALVLEFLSGLYGEGKSYSTINVHRSMQSQTLPNIDGQPMRLLQLETSQTQI